MLCLQLAKIAKATISTRRSHTSSHRVLLLIRQVSRQPTHSPRLPRQPSAHFVLIHHHTPCSPDHRLRQPPTNKELKRSTDLAESVILCLQLAKIAKANISTLRSHTSSHTVFSNQQSAETVNQSCGISDVVSAACQDCQGKHQHTSFSYIITHRVLRPTNS